MTRVRIERELCTGSGDCARAVPEVFWMADDALAMVKEEAEHFGATQRFEGQEEGGFSPWARVPEGFDDAVDLAAANCPGCCIIVEREQAPAPEPEPGVEEAAPAPAPRSFLTKVKGRLRRLLK